MVLWGDVYLLFVIVGRNMSRYFLLRILDYWAFCIIYVGM